MHLGSTRSIAGALNSVIVLASVCCGSAALIASSGEAVAGPAQPSSMGEAQRTRFIIALDRRTEFQVFSLQNPNRVIVELPKVGMALPRQPTNGPVGLVSSFKGGDAGAGKSRVIIQVTSPVVVEKASINKAGDGNTHELSIDILQVAGAKPVQLAQAGLAAPAPKTTKSKVPFDKPFGLGAGGLQPPLPRPAESPKSRAARSFKPIVVIDPGHGGHDSGAKKHGVVEKEVVLEFSLMLRKKLEATGRYKVLMTRDDDTFVSLDERRAFAERNGAELFLAVHADYARSTARGATVYSLRSKVANRLQKSTKRKIAKGIRKDKLVRKAASDFGDIHGILTDLAEREITATRNRTKQVSKSIVDFMGGSTNLRNDPHKTAAFRVLKTAQFPSVLIELAFVSNKKDARLLTSERWRNKVSSSLVSAVDNYFSTELAQIPM